MPKRGKLTTSQRHEIAKRYAKGEKTIALALEFGVCVSNIRYLSRRYAKTPQPKNRYKMRRSLLWDRKINIMQQAGKLTKLLFPANK